MENNNSNNIYHGEYLPFIFKWGKITNWIGVVLAFGPAFVLAVVFKAMPPVSAIMAGFVSIAAAVGINWFVEPISYFPIIGPAGTYMSFISGNISNLRIPCAAVAQKVAEVEPGSDQASIVATLGIAVSIVVNIVVLAVGVLASNAILAQLPKSVFTALGFLLPALFGAIFGQFALKKLKIAPIALAIGLAFTYMVNAGVFSFLPGRPTYVTTLACVFGTIAIGVTLYKRKLI
jgi:hypothetical protein